MKNNFKKRIIKIVLNILFVLCAVIFTTVLTNRFALVASGISIGVIYTIFNEWTDEVYREE